MNRDLLFTITTTTNSVAADQIIPISTIARRYSSRMTLISNAIVISKPGYYKFHADVIASSSTAGDITVVANMNGTPIPSLKATSTVAQNGTATLPIDGVIRVFPSDIPVSLTLVNDGVAISELNVAVTTEYIG